MVERVVWDHEAAGSKPVTRTKNPLGSMISEDFLLWLFRDKDIHQLGWW